MKFKDASIVAAFLIVLTLLAACGPAETPAPLTPTQPRPTDAPATAVPTTAVPPTAAPPAAEWPSARKYGAMVYDPVSEQIFLFGGAKTLYDQADIPDVWAYDPASNTWQELGELGPELVISAVLDSESQRVIVLGHGDTWAYDPAAGAWQEMNPEAQPPRLWSSRMAYDAESDRVIFFGGGTGAATSFDDTWAYDHNTDTWTEMQPAVRPPARAFHGMDYDPENDRILLWGGHTLPGVSDLRVWAYDYNSNTWTTQEAPLNAPEQRNGLGLFYHPPSGRLIVHGGLIEETGDLVEGTTWAYNVGANAWEALAPAQSPGKRAHFPLAYAPSVGKAILFGGELVNKNADEISDEVWIFDPKADEWESITKP